MNFKIGDLVTRNSHNNDIVFKILKLNEEKEEDSISKIVGLDDDDTVIPAFLRRRNGDY